MPKRTTPEQRLVKKIYQSMAAIGAAVVESHETTERGRKAKREVDLLLEQNLFGTLIRIAVEIRGRKRKDTLEWIDGLVGKYKDINVQKIIAISTSGFTTEALSKAHDEKIETLTLDEAGALNWPSQFAKFRIGYLERTDEAITARVSTDPPMTGPLRDDLPVDSESAPFGNFKDYVKSIIEGSKDAVAQKILDTIPTPMNPDIQKGTVSFEVQIQPTKPTYLRLPDGSPFRIADLVLRVQSRYHVRPQKVDHYVLGDRPLALASVVVLGDGESGKTAWTFVQTADNPGLAQLFQEPLYEKPAKKRTKRNHRKASSQRVN